MNYNKKLYVERNIEELIFLLNHLRMLNSNILDEFTYDLSNVDKDLVEPILFIINYLGFDYSLLRTENKVIIRIFNKK